MIYIAAYVRSRADGEPMERDRKFWTRHSEIYEIDIPVAKSADTPRHPTVSPFTRTATRMAYQADGFEW